VRWVLVCCQDNRCGHHVEMDADCWPNDIRLSDIEDRFVCQACGKRGADVRPDLSTGAEVGTGRLAPIKKERPQPIMRAWIGGELQLASRWPRYRWRLWCSRSLCIEALSGSRGRGSRKALGGGPPGEESHPLICAAVSSCLIFSSSSSFFGPSRRRATRPSIRAFSASIRSSNVWGMDRRRGIMQPRTY